MTPRLQEMMKDAKISDHLNELVRYLLISKNAYKECVKSICFLPVRKLLYGLVNIKQKMLAKLIEEFGEFTVSAPKLEQEKSSKFQEIMHLNQYETLATLLEKIKGGEDAIIDFYHKILNENMPPEVKAILNNQLVELKVFLVKFSKKSHNLSRIKKPPLIRKKPRPVVSV